MAENFGNKTKDLFWNYRWTMGDRPVAFFGNPHVNTNVIYTLDELRRVVKLCDEEISFVPVPRKVLQNALDVFDGELELAA